MAWNFFGFHGLEEVAQASTCETEDVERLLGFRIHAWRLSMANRLKDDGTEFTQFELENPYRMLPTDDGGESYRMECKVCKAEGSVTNGLDLTAVHGGRDGSVRCRTQSCSLSARSSFSHLDSTIHFDRCRYGDPLRNRGRLDRGRSSRNASCSGPSADISKQLCWAARLSGMGTLLPLLQFSFRDDADSERAFDPYGSPSSLFQ
jgi:hypothetical protein